jgi:glycosyltransferase involved in cell wall biosynthesis
MGAFESAEFESALRAAIEEAGLVDRVLLLGRRTGEDKAACFAASDVFCYPTFFESETFGLVVIEAMQFALPVAAARWRGVPSVVADGESGLLVPPRDPDKLAHALETLLSDPDMRRSMGRRGRELYLEHYTESRYRANMEAALLTLSRPA